MMSKMTRLPATRAGARLALVCALLVVSPVGAEQELPVYPGTLHTRIGNDLVIGGEYYRLAYFTTPDPMEKVAAYFVRKWQEEGYPTAVEGDMKDEGVVSALYTRQGLQRGVVLRRHLGKTLGFTVLRDLWMRPPKKPAPGLVKLEGSLYSQDLATRDDPGGSQSRTSLVSGGLTEVQQRMAAELQRRGYEPVRQSAIELGGSTRVTLEHARKGEQVVTSLSPVDEGVTAVMQMWIGSDRPDAVPNDDAIRESREAYEKQQKAKAGEGAK
jgi:hypothetical protein